jgi:hypothetical protein
LINLNNIKCKKVIIYNAPVSNEFKKKSVKNKIWEVEKIYNSVIANYIKTKRLKNLEFYDLMELEGFIMTDYYDPQHFCITGAKKFSKKIDLIFKLRSFFIL